MSGPWLPLLVFVGIVVVVGAVGVRLGMLLAPRIDRWADRAADTDEDGGGDDD